jgi:hypothetical protein
MSTRTSHKGELHDFGALEQVEKKKKKERARVAPGQAGVASTSGLGQQGGIQLPPSVREDALSTLLNNEDAFYLHPCLGGPFELPPAIMAHPKLRGKTGSSLLSALASLLQDVVSLVDTYCFPSNMTLTRPWKVNMNGATGWDQAACMEWVLQPNAPKGLYPQGRKGYLQLRVDKKKNISVHRLVLLAVWGAPNTVVIVEEGCVLKRGDWITMHLCDNPRCLNPLHLAYGSDYDNNNSRKDKKKTHQLKVDAKRARLTWWNELVKLRGT